ncbi:DUF2752 domain-containing protein [Belliella kenyensis]|uniref:DUF2752 domain-containing protein n=1 Tax=Belliella kenyensis TaxID=1472724 RepID=A0ABV8EES6_9BACT|nr:DUF2752 domain-containing protein [Belliella kenyensis]MCH7401918.1 DUF2752 domain-containing protein [Belliella kenyensis]MDN3604418.1 DUF2752 domain-containing protein [Belliella kenyensis]
MRKVITTFRKLPFELIFWIGALIGILRIDPYSGDHFSLCPLDSLGFTWCPGCGLGRSMSLLSKGDFHASWSMHPLAMFAFAVIIFRIYELIRNFKTTQHNG